MAGFIQGVDRAQATLLPECLEDWASESNPVRVIDAFVEALDLGGLGFSTVAPADTARPGNRRCRVATDIARHFLRAACAGARSWLA